ncbi:MAG: NADH dehydrogenase [Verrucomicrobia bacterium]|nr:NADH dehydrogenase [Verrucomicrobiota bacterium]
MSAAVLTQFLLLAAVLAPVVTALALVFPRWRATVKRFAPLAAVPAVLLALSAPTDANVSLPWVLKHVVLTLDDVGRVFLGFTSVLWLASAWYARGYLAKDAEPVRFWVFFLAAMASNFTLILAADIPTFYVGFAVMGFASAGLVLHRGDAEAGRAGRIYMALAMIGEVFLLTALSWLAVKAGTTDIHALPPEAFSPLVIGLVLVGFGIKAGALCLHFWLPLAHPAAPVPASAVLSGAMIKAGLLGWLRFLPLGDSALPEIGLTLVAMGLGAAFLGAVAGVTQKNPKTVLAYSSISQMGIITVGVGAGLAHPQAWSGILAAVLVYTVHHGLAKGALFLGVTLAHSADSRTAVWWTRLGLVIPALALAGAPFSSGAVAKLGLKSEIAFLPGAWVDWVSFLLPLAATGTTLMMARFLWLVWPRTNAATEPFAVGTRLPWAFLVVAVVVGVWLLPGTLAWVPEKLTPAMLWKAAWPLIFGGALAWLGAKVQARFPARRHHGIPAGDMVVWFERLAALLPGPGRLPAEHHASGEDLEQSAPRDSNAIFARWRETALRIEQGVRNWSVAGSVILLLLAVMLWLLAGNRP